MPMTRLFFIKANYEMRQIIDAFTLFGKSSGPKLNLEKALAMGLGKWKNKADYSFGIEGKNEIKIYGITFTNRPEQTAKKTWEKLASQTQSLLAYYKRLLTLIFCRCIYRQHQGAIQTHVSLQHPKYSQLLPCENTTMTAQTVSILGDYKQNNIIVQHI